MVGRLRERADFERLLAARPKARSAHFAAHHLAARPGAEDIAKIGSDLSTAWLKTTEQAVDKSSDRIALGLVIPKRHARHATTRNLLRRQVRAAFSRHAGCLEPGLWLIRLRSGWAPGAFVSAASSQLRRAVAAELDELLTEAAR